MSPRSFRSLLWVLPAALVGSAVVVAGAGLSLIEELRFGAVTTFMNASTAAEVHAAAVELGHRLMASGCALLCVSMAPLFVATFIFVSIHRRMLRRIDQIAAFAETVANGATPEPSREPIDDELGRIERSLHTIASNAAEHGVSVKMEAARQHLETQIQRAISMADGEADLLEVAGRALSAVAPSTPAELLLADPSETELHLAAMSATGAFPGCPVETPAACMAMRTGQTMRFPHSEALDACPKLRGRGSSNPCAAICVPLNVMGRGLGVLHATTDPSAPFSDTAVGELELIATHVGGRLRMLQALENFQQQAATDPLTGLLNRRSFEEKVNRLLRRSGPLALAMADLDHFKRLNDEAGHAAGDHALRVFAKTILGTLRPSDIAGRIGGEEFALVLPGCGVDGALVALERLREALRQSIVKSSARAFTASFGLAVFPDHADNLRDLLAAADRALYDSKRAGRDRITVAGRGGAPAGSDPGLRAPTDPTSAAGVAEGSASASSSSSSRRRLMIADRPTGSSPPLA